jgi:hypothetical protein
VVDAAAMVARQPGFDAREVAGIDVAIGATQAWMARHHEVHTPFQAKYSVEFAAVSGLVAQDASFPQLRDAFIHDALVQRLIAATKLQLSEERSVEDPVFSPADRVQVRMRDGRVFDSGPVPFASGHALAPLPEQARRAKFLQCAASGGQANAEALYALIARLPTLADVRAIAACAAA